MFSHHICLACFRTEILDMVKMFTFKTDKGWVKYYVKVELGGHLTQK